MSSAPPGSRDTPTRRIRIWRQQEGRGRRATTDHVALEEPLEIRVETRPISVTMRTPGHDTELAAGFLVSEGVLRNASDVAAIRPNPRNTQGNSIDVFLHPGVRVDLAQLTRHVFATSSCGLCGKASIQAVRQRFTPIRRDGIRVTTGVLLRLAASMRSGQAAFDLTGGLHAAALFTLEGGLVVLREDVGRHNAVDKVVGHVLLNDNRPEGGGVLLVSGRASFEILQKALAARIAIVAAVSAPSSLAVEFARRNGQTLVGFLREDRMNIYSGPGRVR